MMREEHVLMALVLPKSEGRGGRGRDRGGGAEALGEQNQAINTKSRI